MVRTNTSTQPGTKEIVLDRCCRGGWIELCILRSTIFSSSRCVFDILLCGRVSGTLLASAAAGWRTPNVRFLDLQGRESSANTLPDFGHDVVTLLCKQVFGPEYEYIDMFELPDMFVAVFTPLCLIFCRSSSTSIHDLSKSLCDIRNSEFHAIFHGRGNVVTRCESCMSCTI